MRIIFVCRAFSIVLANAENDQILSYLKKAITKEPNINDSDIRRDHTLAFGLITTFMHTIKYFSYQSILMSLKYVQYSKPAQHPAISIKYIPNSLT